MEPHAQNVTGERRLIVVREIAREIGVAHYLFAEWIYEGKLPRPILVGRRGRTGPKRASAGPIAMGYLEGAELEQVKQLALTLKDERRARMEGLAR